jgi:hypothetical protein
MMTCRVFGKSTIQPDPRPLAEFLNRFGTPVVGDFFGDEQGWTRLELQFGNGRFAVTVERYLAVEEGLRDAFRSWAAWIESANEDPTNNWLMEHMINTQQLFTIRSEAETEREPLVKRICTDTARYLARETKGIYQVDNLGLFAVDGKLLVPEKDSSELPGDP